MVFQPKQKQLNEEKDKKGGSEYMYLFGLDIHLWSMCVYLFCFVFCWTKNVCNTSILVFYVCLLWVIWYHSSKTKIKLQYPILGMWINPSKKSIFVFLIFPILWIQVLEFKSPAQEPIKDVPITHHQFCMSWSIYVMH